MMFSRIYIFLVDNLYIMIGAAEFYVVGAEKAIWDMANKGRNFV